MGNSLSGGTGNFCGLISETISSIGEHRGQIIKDRREKDIRSLPISGPPRRPDLILGPRDMAAPAEGSWIPAITPHQSRSNAPKSTRERRSSKNSHVLIGTAGFSETAVPANWWSSCHPASRGARFSHTERTRRIASVC